VGKEVGFQVCVGKANVDVVVGKVNGVGGEVNVSVGKVFVVVGKMDVDSALLPHRIKRRRVGGGAEGWGTTDQGRGYWDGGGPPRSEVCLAAHHRIFQRLGGEP
jgi:hypothetical protein